MRPRLLLTAALTSLVLPLACTAAWADPDGVRDDRAASPALARAEALFEADAAPPVDRDATLVLRDLVRSLDTLDGRERDRAERVLARPDDGAFDGDLPAKYGAKVRTEVLCAVNVCVHWPTSTVDAPPPDDTDGDGVPDQVAATAAVFEESWSRLVGEAGAGYRSPLDDSASANHGPDGRLDVYLADIGDLGYYGYCTSDDPASTRRRTVSAYCVVDDDFSRFQFGEDPATSLRVTAAHEFFHAVQFAYDFWEDIWFMEGTAAWAEELVYDELNDNLRYLRASQIAKPWLPLTRVAGPARYGSWVFWQFLTERFATTAGADPTVVRDVWQRAAGDTRSLQALGGALRARGVPFVAAYASFGVANLSPARFYEEGASFGGGAPVTRSLTLTRSQPSRVVRDATLDHLTTDYYRFRPDATLTGSRRLRVVVDMPRRSRGSAATVVVLHADGRMVPRPLRLSSTGAGSTRVAFSPGSVKAVYVVLTNGGRHDDERTVLRAQALRS